MLPCPRKTLGSMITEQLGLGNEYYTFTNLQATYEPCQQGASQAPHAVLCLALHSVAVKACSGATQISVMGISRAQPRATFLEPCTSHSEGPASLTAIPQVKEPRMPGVDQSRPVSLCQNAYSDRVRQQLNRSLVLLDTPCQHVDGGNKPEVEVQTDEELLLPSITISRTDKEFALIEPSINSLRISFKVSDCMPS
jgi:hypothetical protein